MRLEKKRKIAHLKRTLDIPQNINPDVYCKMYMNNIVLTGIEKAQDSEMNDILSVVGSRQVSDTYDLGSW